jgi:predicted ATPase
MIERLKLINYRNLHMDEGLAFDPLTIFVGPNGSGKTNLIRAMRFLQDAWTGAEDERRGVTGFEGALARWGAGRVLDRGLNAPAVVGFDVHFGLEAGFTYAFDLDLSVAADNAVALLREAMWRWPSGRNAGLRLPFYEADLATKRGSVSRVREGGNEVAPTDIAFSTSAAPNELVAHRLQKSLEAESDIPLKEIPLFEGTRCVEDFVREWSFYDAAQMSIDAIRRASPELGVGDRLLAPSGDNLALVLFNLARDDIEYEDRIQHAVTELFPQTRCIRAVPSGRVSLTVEWYVHGIPKPFFLDEMSEGTVRMLCWAAVLFSPNIPRLIVLDEPEASLHPAWLRVLAGWIRDAARRTQIIVSTHSPDLLDYFSEERASVRVFDKDPDNPLYVRIHGVDEEGIEEKLAEGWKLGDLYRVGDPQVGGWPW